MRVQQARAVHWRGLPWGLLAVMAVIGLLGAYNLHSAAAAHAPGLYATQLTWLGLGVALAAVVTTVDYRVTESLAYWIYAAVIALLGWVLVAGRASMGATRWLRLGPLVFQPSELAKVAVIVAMARYFGRRLPTGGWTIAALARPLNPSRPLLCLLALVVLWRRPAMVDPLGELARRVHEQVGAPGPAVGELLGFRLLLVALVAALAAAAVAGMVHLERAAQLLNPWPAGRRHRLLALIAVMTAAAAAALALNWQAAALRDPIGALLAALWRRAAPGGDLSLLQPGWGLRAVLTAAVALYALAAAVVLLRRGGAPADLVVAPLDVLVLPALLVLAQPDLGTAGIIILVGMTMVLVVGVRARSLLLLALIGTKLSALAWLAILKDYQKRRILTFIDPEQDLRGAGWNAVQSLIAVGSGRWTGKGHRGGSQTQLSFLPEQHTDFAFSVWAEEQGFLGSVLLLVLYAVVIVLALNIAREARDTYGSLVATGVAAMALWQVIINVGMVIGVLPVVGITLPLFSYGGSSVLTVMLAFGLLVNVFWRRRA